MVDADQPSPPRLGFRRQHLYKLPLDSTIFGMLGESGRDVKQFNWVHRIAWPSPDLIDVADMNKPRVQRLALETETR